MNEKPSVLFVSSSSTKPGSIIKLMTKDKTTELKPGEKGEICFPWHIDTKYYSADVNLVAIDNLYQRTPEFNQTVEALVIHMDTNKESGLEDLSMWQGIEKDCEPEVKLLIANYCSPDTKVSLEKALKWCLSRGFEFIELYPTFPKKESDDELIEEKVGVDRIIEALETHTWPNLIMKVKQKRDKAGVSSNETPEEAVEECFDYIKGQMVTECIKFVDTFEEYLPDDGMDDFGELLAEVNSMRDGLRDMPSSQRKLCAEKMAKAFWRVIGGDEEEIADA